jgi:conjugal transfer pilus assembly protein TraB
MTNNPFDFEAERNRMAKELGLTYSDNGKAVFWQENMQAQEAKRELTEILANERKPNRTSAFEETPNSAQEPAPESSAAGRDFDQPRSYQEADDTCDAIYSQGRTTESQSEQTAGVSMAKEHSKLSLKLRMKSMFNRFQGFAQSRKERSQASGVAAQQKEKKKQVQTAVAGLTVVFVLVTGAMIVADERRARPEPVRVYKSDFRLEPDALDKQSYQKQYDEKLAGMTERLQTIEELAMRLQKELDAKEGKRTAGKSDAASDTSVPVTELPPFSAQGANREAQSLGTAMNAGAAAVVPIDSPRLKRLAVTDPVKDFEAIRTAARERFTPKRANAGDTPIAANRARNEAAGTYLPAGSFARAVVLAGATVSTGGTASSNPVPMLLEIKDLARLPNAFRANVKACFVTANATGDLSSERVWIRLERLSCMTQSGKALDARIQGYVTGDDGKTGVRARLVTRSGQAIASALLTGSISGLGKAVSLSAQDTTTYTSGAVGTTVSDSFRAGLGEGLESALDRIADYYIRLADKIFPCLEIDSGRKVDLILSQGLTVAVDETTPQESASQAMPLAADEGEAVNSSELFGQQMKAASALYD